MSKLVALLPISILALGEHARPSLLHFRFSKKKCVKRAVLEKQLKPGRNRPAKGYDMIAKMWKEPK